MRSSTTKLFRPNLDKSSDLEDKDYRAIYDLLLDVTLVTAQLVKLEAELEKCVGPDYDSSKSKQKKVLRNYFEKWAHENGFLGFAKISDFLTTEEFFGLLKAGTLFFDKTFAVNSSHGELTHAIQWWLVPLVSDTTILKISIDYKD